MGFCKAAIRQEGIRKGFELVDLKEKGGVLSHIDFKGGERVGRYKVDVDGFGDLFDGMSFFDPSSAVIMIGEIGKWNISRANSSEFWKRFWIPWS